MHQSGRTKVLTDIEDAMRREQSIGSLLAMLSSLLHVAETTVDHAKIEAERMNELAGYMAEIRHLLGHVQSDSRQPAVSRMAKDIAARYRDLEGRVKEIRNDCAANGK